LPGVAKIPQLGSPLIGRAPTVLARMGTSQFTQPIALGRILHSAWNEGRRVLDLPEIIRTLGDAVDMIDEHLPETLRIRPVWQQVKDMLVTAAVTRTAQDVETATTLLEHALEEEGWLH